VENIPINFKSDLPVKRKVMIYILSPDCSKVLTFLQPDSPEAGRQIPAGTVERNELLDSAATRELQEETGCSDVPSLVGFAQTLFDMRRYKPEIHERFWYFGIDRSGAFPEEGWVHVEKHANGSDIKAAFEWITVDQSAQLIAGHGHLVPLAVDLASVWHPK
jgi:8-oxo-dGTP diphosphatase